MDDVDISEQKLLEKCPDALCVLLKDHSRTRHAIDMMSKDGRKAGKDFQQNIIWGTNNYLAETGSLIGIFRIVF